MNEGKRGPKPTQPDAALRALCSNLSAGLHAVAQPLAILRASLGSDVAGRMSMEELRQLATGSAVEVERVCAMFRCMQQLVNLEAAVPQLASMPLQPVLAEAVEGVELLFEEDEIALRCSVPPECDSVLIDKRRTLQALSSVLMTAHAVSRPADTVEATVTSREHGISVVVQNASARPEGIMAEWSLNMTLAEANLRSQSAGFTWSPSPFYAQIDFRKASSLHYC